MASIKELERRDPEVGVAERRAVEGLAEHLREAMRGLPSESKLGLIFVQQANKLEACARERTPRLGADHYLSDIERELREIQDEADDDGEGE